ncbi:sigma 54-interacting transcriptional regulator [Spirochaeta isovalerica]|uniref:DNA-binding NtrC family response regulator n=1 Tax=Spirochaeta isovalerica TaxID=150 RepID=A0A841RD69_9SPIO|nr:DNA-binding NtrC family response regulator [Spirochaeta isovalerica]
MASLLIIDRDEKVRKRTLHFFTGSGHNIIGVPDFPSAQEILRTKSLDVIISECDMAGGNILQLIREVEAGTYHTMIIVSSPIEEVSAVVQAIKEGASDFVRKPFNQGELYVKVEKALEIRRLHLEAQNLRGQQHLIYKTREVIGDSPPFREVLKIVEKVAKSDSTIMLRGETGTGKELIAGLVHYNSLRTDKAFIRVNCAALPDELLESELFGHEKGAFTGADKVRIGRFEQADGGTIFLDEIADMSLKTQAKVLRVLQEQTFERLGSSRTIEVNVRVISATNKNLEEEIGLGTFREDLLYRLNVIRIDLPPLRERQADILMLAHFFMLRYSKKINRKIYRMCRSAEDKLLGYKWPGNIRELENVMERAVLMADDEITCEDIYLPTDRNLNPSSPALSPEGVNLSLEEMEKQLILKALEQSGWVQKKAAELLKISSRSLNYKISKYAIAHSGWQKNR